MATVHDVARYILEQRGAMTAMKLQKLVYYSQAWSLARRTCPLFDADVQAWAHGPVVYELFQLHRGSFVVTHWPSGDSTALSGRERALIEAVLGYYGDRSAAELSDLTHREGPWKRARQGIPAGMRASAVISKDSMRRYYASQADAPL